MSEITLVPAPDIRQPTVQSGTEAGVQFRKARLKDIPGVLRLINNYARLGIMLPRTELELAENIRDFSVMTVDGSVAACGALHIYSDNAAEVRSLAVLPEHQGMGAGRRIVTTIEDEAREFGLAALFAFTYVEEFFARLGYREVDRGELPLKAWKDCLRCPKFTACDEVAMLKVLDEEAYRARLHAADTGAPVPGSVPELVVLPRQQHGS